MCTLTWARTTELDAGSNSSDSTSGYHIHFNRDESRLRSRALPPQLLKNEGVDYLAPIDPDALGTWIFVNSRGFSACLLNNYIVPPNPVKGSRSRGLLVKDLTQIQDISEALVFLDHAGIENYSPFDLYLFDTRQVYSVGWDGKARMDTEKPKTFKSSSGFNTEAVINCREKHYLTNEKNLESLREFHRSHTPDKSAYSTCMHRDDAKTQSYTEISINNNQATMRYTDGSPCSSPLSEPISVALT